jgi:hypothetical protein
LRGRKGKEERRGGWGRGGGTFLRLSLRLLSIFGGLTSELNWGGNGGDWWCPPHLLRWFEEDFAVRRTAGCAAGDIQAASPTHHAFILSPLSKNALLQL